MLCVVGIDLVFLSPYASARMPALLLTSFIWALSFGLLGNCLSGLPASFVALARMAGSFAVFLPFVRKAPLSHAVGMMGIGAVQFGGMYLFYIAAFHYLPSHQVALYSHHADLCGSNRRPDEKESSAAPSGGGYSCSHGRGGNPLERISLR